jgi:hypothetical protein
MPVPSEQIHIVQDLAILGGSPAPQLDLVVDDQVLVPGPASPPPPDSSGCSPHAAS